MLGNAAIYVMSLDGGQRRAVAGANFCCPRWSSDGEWIYLSEILGSDGGVRRIPAGGGGVEVLTSIDRSDGHHGIIDVLPDDRGLLIQEQSAETREDRIMVLDFASGEMRFLTPGTHPRYSPTGHVLFIDPQSRLIAAPFDLRALTLEGPGVALGDSVARVREGTGFFSVSKTGRIVYLTQPALGGAGELVPVRVGRDATVAAIDPGWSIRGDPTFTSVELSPDGQRLAVSIQDSDGRWDVRVKALDRGPFSRATFRGATNFRATWSSDSQRLTFSGDGNVWTARADGAGTPELVLDREAGINEAFYSPDGGLARLPGG